MMKRGKKGKLGCKSLKEIRASLPEHKTFPGYKSYSGPVIIPKFWLDYNANFKWFDDE